MNILGTFVTLIVCLAVTMEALTQSRAVPTGIEGFSQFSPAFYREIASKKPDNLITSPLSAWLALSMAAYGSCGETETEFKQVLHLPEESIGRTEYANLIDSINSLKDVKLHIANKIFVDDKFSIKPSFHELTQAAFRSTSQNVNFCNSQTAVETINEWVEKQTNNRIKDLLSPDQINGTVMVLVNALYFRGNWMNEFLSHLTEDRPFHVSKSQVKNVPTMYNFKSYTFGFLPELKAKFIELPYQGSEVFMIIILPDEVDGLAEVEQKLAQKDLTELLKERRRKKVELRLPKFKIESTLNLNVDLQNVSVMGLKKAFDEVHANFSGISDTRLFISHVVQKAFLEVDEEGSEAGVSSSILIGVPLSGELFLEEPLVFNVDHPFYLSIVKRDRFSDTIIELFSARVVDPSK